MMAHFFWTWFFATHQKEVSVEKGNQLDPELGMHDVVFVGSIAGNRNLQGVLAGLDLVLESKGIRNLNPKSGEDSFFADRLVEDAGLEEGYALITHTPGLNGEGVYLYFVGEPDRQCCGRCSTLTDPGWARVLVSRLKDPSGNLPRYFQAILKVRSMDGTIDVAMGDASHFA